MINHRFPGISAQITHVDSVLSVEVPFNGVHLSGKYWLTHSKTVCPGVPRPVTNGEVELVRSLTKDFSPSNLQESWGIQELLWYTGDTGVMAGGDPIGDSRAPVVLGLTFPGLLDFLEDLRGSLDRVRLVRIPGFGSGVSRFEYHRILRIDTSAEHGNMSLVTEDLREVRLIDGHRPVVGRFFLEWPGIPEKYLRYVLIGSGDLYGIDLPRFPWPRRFLGIPGPIWKQIREGYSGLVERRVEKRPVVSVDFSSRVDRGTDVIQDILEDSTFHTVLGETGLVSSGVPGTAYWEGVFVRVLPIIDYVSPVTGIRYQTNFLV